MSESRSRELSVLEEEMRRSYISASRLSVIAGIEGVAICLGASLIDTNLVLLAMVVFVVAIYYIGKEQGSLKGQLIRANIPVPSESEVYPTAVITALIAAAATIGAALLGRSG